MNHHVQSCENQSDDDLIQYFRSFVLKDGYPCLMARSVIRKSKATVKVFGRFDDFENVQRLQNEIGKFIRHSGEDRYVSFIALFKDDKWYSEQEFEQLLWDRLALISDSKTTWNPQVSSDPEDTHFSFSAEGEAFYVVGMHPGSSRNARKSPVPCLVFNPHQQFEELRNGGNYDIIQKKIRNRDLKLQGSVNPMLKNFGEGSEASQYSGRQVDDSWKCPFHPDQ